jgi:hypothetical protein
MKSQDFWRFFDISRVSAIFQAFLQYFSEISDISGGFLYFSETSNILGIFAIFHAD